MLVLVVEAGSDSDRGECVCRARVSMVLSLYLF